MKNSACIFAIVLVTLFLATPSNSASIGDISLSYDKDGNLIERKNVINEQAYTIHTYDSNGNLLRYEWKASGTESNCAKYVCAHTYTYVDGKLATRTDSVGTNAITATAYYNDPDNPDRITSLVATNGTTWTYTYETYADGTLKYVKENGTIIEAYDEKGNLIYGDDITSLLGYAYQDHYMALYEYDDNGNLISKTNINGLDTASQSYVQTTYNSDGTIDGVYQGRGTFNNSAPETAVYASKTEASYTSDAYGNVLGVGLTFGNYTMSNGQTYANPTYNTKMKIYTAEEAYAATSKGNNNSISIRFK